ncbi:MAG TPA: hypothetical protein DEB40_12395 [Elusimicrobia bacterium]|nr:hypothetical protein [Elusimicrobiota bacterium]HBT62534.1 hypothetical protein [Elusimicrobiota bacterium]
MVKIVFVSTSTTLGGAEKTLFCLATSLDPAQFEIGTIVSLKPLGHYGRRLAEQGHRTQSLGIRRWPLPAAVDALELIIQQHRPDIVHAIMYQAIQLCRFVKGRGTASFKLVTSPRVNYRTRPFWTLLADRLLKKHDDLLISESEASREFLVRRLGYDERKVRTIHNGVDISRWACAKLDRQQRRLEMRLGLDDVLIGAVGRLDEQKGHSVLIDAMARLVDLHPVRCAIIGEGPLRGRLEDQIRRLHLEQSVWLLGERDDLFSWLSAFDIFVLPSLWEGLPNALLEAMAAGLPSVASAVDGVLEIARAGQECLLVPPGDRAALSQAVAGLIADPGLRRRLTDAARARINERFDIAGMISRYEAVYREIIGGPPSP